ncbi:MAG: RNA polymerase factor sigma-54 [Ferruginibacter sp.]|nr:RNA polymerase factor sigma-54 [Ferruginibacter sp.]
MALQQSLQQKLLQRLSPQQIQLMKLLQVPTAQLEERIKEELEENPALELADENYEDEFGSQEEFNVDNESDEDPDGSEEDYENIDISDYVSDSDDDTGDYKLRDDFYPDDGNDNKGFVQKVEVGFNELMLQQLGLLKLGKLERTIAEQIIGSLDDDGYLRRDISSIIDDLAFRQNIETDLSTVKRIIGLIKQFDPPGVCAQNLQECLLIQLERKIDEGQNVELAIKVLQKYFDEFTKKHYEKIQKGLNLSDDQLREVIQHIIKLNPKPGDTASEASKAENYIIPDFFVFNNLGKLELTLNSKNAPDLRISEGYRDMLKDYDKGSKKDKRQKEAVVFIKQKLDSAKWFIDAIKQRQETLTNTMNAIIQYQYDFFISGDETDLKPMILKDVAEKTGLDISTISRVANSKFVQTEFGTYRLKFFFSESLQTDSGDEVSTREVKKILMDLIHDENKKNPLSDEALTDMLQEKGYNIARRTVAKYREQLNVPVARLRKIL